MPMATLKAFLWCTVTHLILTGSDSVTNLVDNLVTVGDINVYNGNDMKGDNKSINHTCRLPSTISLFKALVAFLSLSGVCQSENCVGLQVSSALK